MNPLLPSVCHFTGASEKLHPDLSSPYKRDTGVLNVHEEAEELTLFRIEKAELDLIAVFH